MKMKLLSGVVLAAGLAFAGQALADDIKLGVGGPLTGPNAAFGAQLQKGAEQAVADINKAGGILGEKIVLSVGDDVSDPKQGVSVANKFAGEGVLPEAEAAELELAHVAAGAAADLAAVPVLGGKLGLDAVLVDLVRASHGRAPYLRKGMPRWASSARASGSVGAEVTNVMFMPFSFSTLE